VGFLNVDKNAAYPPAIAVLQAAGTLSAGCQLRPVKYLNSLIEHDQRFSKRRVQPGWGCGSYQTAWPTLQGVEALNQLRKGQGQGTTKGDAGSQSRFIAAAVGVAA
jgi:transposase, IS6 family